MKHPSQYKIIIDCDPGIDDTAALILSFFEPKFDIKLITTVSGNRTVDICTRNTLHLLEKFGLNIPVCEGHSEPMERPRKDATHIHGDQGLGQYIPSDPEKLKPISGPAEDRIYEIIKENPNEIILMLFGPHTNAGHLFKKYPDAVNLLRGVIFEGGSPFGYKNTKPYISFNISSDPEAANIVFTSGIKKLLMIPSELGRRHAYIPYDRVMKYKDYSEVGKFVQTIYNEYWERGFEDKRIATNDSCEVFALLKPEYFKHMKGHITVDLEDAPGKTFIDFKSKNPNVTVLMKANRRKINNFIDKKYKSLKDVEVYK